MIEELKVQCQKDGSTNTYFTDGRVYTARHHQNRLYEVKDDRGHPRFIIPGELCPHLKSSGGGRCVGRFVIVE